MVETVKSTYDFIKGALPVRIGILASDDAEKLCLKNNLAFADLIKPFCTLTNEAQIQGSSSQNYRVYNLHVHATDVRKTSSKNEVASSNGDEVANQICEFSASDTIPTINVNIGDYSLIVNRTCPWMDVYRNHIFRSGPQQNHEFIGHLVACMLVVSSSHPNPMQEFTDISQLQNKIQHGDVGDTTLKWMTPNTMKYYILIHDVNEGDIAKAKEVFTSLQSMFGPNAVYLLQINSRTVAFSSSDADVPVPWRQFKCQPKNQSVSAIETNSLDQNSQKHDTTLGCCLTMEDHNTLRNFMQDFIVRALLPHLEKTIRNINEHLSNRKGLHKSIFRATRTIFGSSKSSSSVGSSGYHNDSHELLVRKAADLCFLSQMYDQALHHFHGVKKDYINDQAWLHAAGASEMAALSNFMMRSAKQSYPMQYMEYAINTYVDICKKDYLALRCSLVHAECLQLLGLFQEAAFHLVKMTNDKEDLRSALLLEQAALCYLKMPNPQPKKFAFQLVLAAHRFSKCGQKLHAIRCYEMAAQMYMEKDWQLMNDHLDYAIARLYSSAKDFPHAKNYFRKLLIRKPSLPEAQQFLILREFANAWRKCGSLTNSDKFANLLLPELALQETSVIVGNDAKLGDPVTAQALNSLIRKVEQEFSDKKLLSRNSLVSAVTHLCRSTDNTEGFQVAVGEVMSVVVTCTNHLGIPVTLSGIKLQLDYVKSDESIEDSQDSYYCKSIDRINLESNGKSELRFIVKPTKSGKFIAKALSYGIGCCLNGEQNNDELGPIEVMDRQLLNIRGKRLNQLREEKLGVFYGPDNRLSLHAYGQLPDIKGSFETLPVSMICNEIRQATLTVRNTGKFSISHLEFAPVGPFVMEPLNPVSKYSSKRSDTKFYSLLSTPLAPGNVGRYDVKLQAPSSAGQYSVNVLLFCKSNDIPSPPYRSYLLQHQITCFDGVNILIDLVNPMAEANCVISACVEGITGRDADKFSFEKISLMDSETPLSPIGNDGSSTVPLFTKLHRYFRLDKGQFMDFNTALSDSTKQTTHVKWNFEGNSPAFKVDGEQIVDVKLASLIDRVNNESRDDNFSSAEVLKYLHHTISWRLAVNHTQSHDFSSKRLCMVSCELVAINTSKYKLDVFISASKPTASTTSALHSSGFSWMGLSKVKRTIEPYGKTTVVLKACFTKPGIFNLSGVVVSATPTDLADQVLIPQKPSSSYFINIMSLNCRSD